MAKDPNYDDLLDELKKMRDGIAAPKKPEEDKGFAAYFTLFSVWILASLINQLANLAVCCFCAATVNRALDVFEVPIVFTTMQVAGVLIAGSIAVHLARVETLLAIISLAPNPTGDSPFDRLKTIIVGAYAKAAWYKVIAVATFSLAWVLMPLMHKLASLLISTN